MNSMAISWRSSPSPVATAWSISHYVRQTPLSIMRSLEDILNNRSPRVIKPITEAHFTEMHYLWKKGSWDDGAAALTQAFPKEARTERAAPWYQSIMDTHGPGQIMPGNAPYYVPSWLISEVDEPEIWKTWTAALKKAGFVETPAHVAFLPYRADYLVRAMQIAKSRAWTANPRTYRLYVYPTLGESVKFPLRTYTVQRFIPEIDE